MKKIRKAILPVAGFGTRFLPITKALPKEMLPVVDRPVIQHLVEQLVEAGIEEIIFVISRGKESIESHFDHSYELNRVLEEANKKDLLKKIQNLEKIAKISYVRQPLSLGDGHAINCASHLLEKDEPVLVLFGDMIYDSKVSPAKQIFRAYKKYQEIVVGLTTVEDSELPQFGVIDGREMPDGTYRISKIVEKPKIKDAPSNLIVPGIYIISPEIIKILSKMKSGKSGEIRLADAFDIYLNKKGAKMYGHPLQGDWLDIGNPLKLIKANLILGLKDPEIKDELQDLVNKLSTK